MVEDTDGEYLRNADVFTRTLIAGVRRARGHAKALVLSPPDSDACLVLARAVGYVCHGRLADRVTSPSCGPQAAHDCGAVVLRRAVRTTRLSVKGQALSSPPGQFTVPSALSRTRRFTAVPL